VGLGPVGFGSGPASTAGSGGSEPASKLIVPPPVLPLAEPLPDEPPLTPTIVPLPHP
jgi:hypothetical protein